MRLVDHLRSTVVLLGITLNLSFWVVGLVLLGVAKAIVPAFEETANRGMDRAYRTAVAIDDEILRAVSGVRWTDPVLDLPPDQLTLVISNHRCWADIFLLQSAIARHGPLLKFLTKRELVFIPILGIIFWAFDFPLLRRRAGRGEDEATRQAGDRAALHAACEVLRERPAALLNFVEGTRFTPEKQRATESPYPHLLRPRVGGLLLLLEALDDLETIVDVTIVAGPEFRFWSFLAGRSGPIEVAAECLPASEAPRDREGLKAWLADRWAKKEARLAAARAREGKPPS